MKFEINEIDILISWNLIQIAYVNMSIIRKETII